MDPLLAPLIGNLVIFLGSLIALAGVIYSARQQRKTKADRAPVDERDDKLAEVRMVIEVNNTLSANLRDFNLQQERFVAKVEAEMAKKDTEIKAVRAQLHQREGDVTRLYQAQGDHHIEVSRLRDEISDLKDLLHECERQRDDLRVELKAAKDRIEATRPEAIQDQVAKQRAVHSNTGPTSVDGEQ